MIIGVKELGCATGALCCGVQPTTDLWPLTRCYLELQGGRPVEQVQGCRL